jgi:hypothetical protein
LPLKTQVSEYFTGPPKDSVNVLLPAAGKERGQPSPLSPPVAVHAVAPGTFQLKVNMSPSVKL